MLQHVQHLVDDLPRRALEGLEHLHRRDRHLVRQARLGVAALDEHRDLLRPLIHAADGDLDLLRRVQTDEHPVVLAHIGRNGLVKRVARDLDGRGRRNAVQTQNGDIRRAAADIDDHMPVRTRDIELRTQRRSIRLFNQIHAARACFHRRLNDRALFDLCHAGRHTDNHAGLNQGKFADFLEELVEHFLGHLIV